MKDPNINLKTNNNDCMDTEDENEDKAPCSPIIYQKKFSFFSNTKDCTCPACSISLRKRSCIPNMISICPVFVEKCVEELRSFIKLNILEISNYLDQYIDEFRELLDKLTPKETSCILCYLSKSKVKQISECKCMQFNTIPIDDKPKCLSVPQYVIDSILSVWIRIESINDFSNEVVNEVSQIIKMCDHAITTTLKAFTLYTFACLNFAKKINCEAIKYYKLCTSIEPRFFPAYIDLANIVSDAFGDDKCAIDLLSEAISYSPKVSRLYIERGCLYDKLNDHLKAYNDFCISVEIDPENPDAYFNRGAVYLSMQRYREAINDFNNSISLDPSCPIAYSNRGIAKMQMKLYEEALTDFSESLKRKNCPHVESLYDDILNLISKRYCFGNM